MNANEISLSVVILAGVLMPMEHLASLCCDLKSSFAVF
jgi:hypothetical protein